MGINDKAGKYVGFDPSMLPDPPKLPDLEEDLEGGNVYGEAPWHQNPPEVTAPVTWKDPLVQGWYVMAERAQTLQEQGKPVSLKTIEELGDPVQCECGKAYYSSDDYMCPNCREVLDA